MSNDLPNPASHRPAWLIIVLAIAPAIGLGICRFGYAVVSATTAFARLNYQPGAWPTAIVMTTIAFGLGQTWGPIATRAITDATGRLSSALNVSAAVLVAGVLACMVHTGLRHEPRAMSKTSAPILPQRQGCHA